MDTFSIAMPHALITISIVTYPKIYPHSYLWVLLLPTISCMGLMVKIMYQIVDYLDI